MQKKRFDNLFAELPVFPPRQLLSGLAETIKLGFKDVLL